MDPWHFYSGQVVNRVRTFCKAKLRDTCQNLAARRRTKETRFIYEALKMQKFWRAAAKTVKKHQEAGRKQAAGYCMHLCTYNNERFLQCLSHSNSCFRVIHSGRYSQSLTKRRIPRVHSHNQSTLRVSSIARSVTKLLYRTEENRKNF